MGFPEKIKQKQKARVSRKNYNATAADESEKFVAEAKVISISVDLFLSFFMHRVYLLL